MTPNVRIYESEQAAQDVAARLGEAGFSQCRALLAGAVAGEEKEAVRSAVEDGLLPAAGRVTCVRSLQQGRSLVAVRAPFGRGQEAIQILESSETVDTDVLARQAPRDPSPLSDMLGIPTLTEFVPLTGLKSSYWTLSSFFSFDLLSDNPTPLSSRFGWKVLKGPERPWNKSFGQPMLSDDPAPLSSKLGWKTVSPPPRPWETSFGLPLLSSDPAPLSTLLGMPTLTKRR